MDRSRARSRTDGTGAPGASAPEATRRRRPSSIWLQIGVESDGSTWRALTGGGVYHSTSTAVLELFGCSVFGVRFSAELTRAPNTEHRLLRSPWRQESGDRSRARGDAHARRND